VGLIVTSTLVRVGGVDETMASQLTERARFLYRGVGTVVVRAWQGFARIRYQWGLEYKVAGVTERGSDTTLVGQMLQQQQQQLKSATRQPLINTATTPLQSQLSKNTCVVSVT
jgi:hypothetical protein